MKTLRDYQFKKTKIICTIGPASQEVEIISEMAEKGMNVARLNCSHGDHKTLKEWIQNIRKAEKKTGIAIPIMLDLQGPKIRVGVMEEGKPIRVFQDQKLMITTEEVAGNGQRISTIYQDLPKVVKKGDIIFINDGMVLLRVVKKTNKEIHTIVKTGGVISDHKGINVPHANFKKRGLTSKDLKDLKFGLENGVEVIAISFVESKREILEIRKRLGKKYKDTLIVAKIERAKALENIDEIIDAADGVMIARGDLGVEIKLEKVPITQKNIIQKAMQKKKFSIVATQMLESMTQGPRPTRAEVSDVANSILDNADGIMLSAETAMGSNPSITVKMMSQIALEIERNHEAPHLPFQRRMADEKNITHALTWSALQAAEALKVKSIVVFTNTGQTARSLSIRRPHQQIIAFTRTAQIKRLMQMYWGVYAVEFPEGSYLEKMYSLMEKFGAEEDLWKSGENIIVLSGPPGITGGTNLLKVHQVGRG